MGGKFFQNEGGRLKTWAESVGSNLTPDGAQKVETDPSFSPSSSKFKLGLASMGWSFIVNSN